MMNEFNSRRKKKILGSADLSSQSNHGGFDKQNTAGLQAVHKMNQKLIIQQQNQYSSCYSV
jgi:hypothetical protein